MTDALVLVIYLAFLGYLVVRVARRPARTATDYLLAGRALSLPAFVGTLVSSWYGGILGVGEYGYQYGISSWLVFGVPYYVAAIGFGIFVAGRARRSPYVSIPDALRANYGDGAARIGAALVFIMTAPGAYVLMLGTLFHFVFGWPAWIGVVLGAVLSLSYVVRGGLRAVVQTDMLQFALMFGAFGASVIYLVATRGVDPILNDVPASHWTWHGGNSAQYIIVWFFIALATFIEPSFYQRVFAARSPQVARRGIFISVGFWIVFDMMTTTAALYARALLPELTDPLQAFPALAVHAFPPVLAALFFVGMLATIMSTVDTNGFIAANTLANLLSRDTDETSGAAAARTRWGILGTAIWSVTLALASGSVVELWHGLGSVGTPALLLPMLGSFYAPLRIRRSAVIPWIVAPGIIAAAWLFGARDGGYWLNLEPIYAGLTVSVVVRLLAGRPRSTS